MRATITASCLHDLIGPGFGIFTRNVDASLRHGLYRRGVRFVDLAILHAAADRRTHSDRRTGFTPFDPATKRSEATLSTGTRTVRVTKGAPQVIAALAGQPPDPDVARLAADGARVVAVAASEHADTWRQVSLLALSDSPRPDAAAMLAYLTELGVRVVMVTGDSAATAAAIAAQVGIAGPTHVRRNTATSRGLVRAEPPPGRSEPDPSRHLTSNRPADLTCKGRDDHRKRRPVGRNHQ